MPRVLIVDDSPTARLALVTGLRADPELQVVGEAATGAEALRSVRELQPDIVTMDVYLRRENGIEVTASIMATMPRPILVVTGINPSDPKLLYAAIEAGALDVFPKLPSPHAPGYEAARRRLSRVIKALAVVPVVHHFHRRSTGGTAAKADAGSGSEPRTAGRRVPPAAVLIGASTGGPPAVAALLRSIPVPSPVPILVVQHICLGFGAGLASWLAQMSGHRVDIVEGPVGLEPGRVYLPKDGHHMRLLGPTLATVFDEDAGVHRPSIDVLFQSAAAHLGERAVAVILSGMGSDGADGLLALRRAGAITLAQAPATCVVDSMPKSAIERGAVGAVLAPEDLAVHIVQAVGGERRVA